MGEEGGSDYRQWDEMIPDALGIIFKKLPLEDILTVIPRVCKSWGKAVQGPYCWQEIDIDEWSSVCQPENVDRMLRLLITRSYGSLRKLNVSRVNNDQIFAFIVEQYSKTTLLKFHNNVVKQLNVEIATPKTQMLFLKRKLLRISYKRSIELLEEVILSRTLNHLRGPELLVDNAT
ncbi:F-box protein FBW2-like [Silene latifolia]|uniref:F-box protein FBW2-like n=1 Tax=Silene latifolia TaxID=37657 RepID=UPI003D7731DA